MHHLYVLLPLIKDDGWLEEWGRYDSMVDHSAFQKDRFGLLSGTRVVRIATHSD